ncbi:MAG: phosphopantothenate/pantothenate synthetase [Thermoplasmata archaeon]|nr:MAG: phosphopantothenate/pantothenate synthetase [Thermoplasmata archaeon]KAA0010518.1 MAG: phosphopantothenate/pantothenate synthetase [Thermoplasmata archaeon]
MKIPRSHPRYHSLVIREKLAEGFRKGLVHETGLIAHGRGEAFDYLIGERTTEIAQLAEKTAAALLLIARHPVISVNGNTASLVGRECVELARKIPAKIEVNLFHRTEERVRRIIEELESFGAQDVLGDKPDARIEGLDHPRGLCCREGIYSADVVLVPLEDGDRCEALVKMGKKVIAIDLNPLSRTSQRASITIVDNVVRAIPNISKWVDELRDKDMDELREMVDSWDNKKSLQKILEYISKRINPP